MDVDRARTTRSSERPRRRGRGLLSSFQSKLLAMFIVVAAVCTATIGAIGVVAATDSLREAAYDQLTGVRNARAVALETVLDGISDNIVLTSKSRTVVDATAGFTAGFAALDAGEPDAAGTASVEAYYDDVFLPGYEAATGTAAESALFLPDATAALRLQALYTAPFTDFDAAAAQDDAGDGSLWSGVHAEYNPYFRDMAERYGYDDILLVDLSGDVVYSVYKGIDLGTNLRTGPFSRGALASAYDEAVASNALDAVVFRDFEAYQPSNDVPTAWAVTAVGDGDSVIGALAVQFPTSAVNTLMTGDEGWAEEGLGASGETYLVGPDDTMRSIARKFAEDPAAYVDAAVDAGLSPETAARIEATGDTVLLQTVDTDSAAAALRGESGTVVETNYLGHEVLSSYAPVTVGGTSWAIVASIDTAEAFAPVTALTRTMVFTAAGLLVVVSVLSLVLARVLTGPIRALAAGVGRVRDGELGATVAVTTRDEFGDLTRSFNDLSRSLAVRQQLLEEQRTENDRLLASVMPAGAVRRYRAGDETVAAVHDDVTVLYADVAGLDELSGALPADEQVALVNDLLRAFTEAADRIGVESVRALRQGYLASSGLSTPRVDNVRRMMEFALEMTRIVERYNARHGSALQVTAALDSGRVTGGLLGRGTLAYDLWGGAVSVAHAVHDAAGQSGVYGTVRIKDALDEGYRLDEAGSVETPEGHLAVWRIEAD